MLLIVLVSYTNLFPGLYESIDLKPLLLFLLLLLLLLSPPIVIDLNSFNVLLVLTLVLLFVLY